MKRITVLCIVLLLVLSFAPVASAGKPGGPLLFTLTFWGYPTYTLITQGPEDSETCKHVKMLNFHAEGGVEFSAASPYPGLQGTFAYDERINVNPGQSKATEQGDLTLSFGDQGTINIRFVGRSELVFESLPWDCETPPLAIIVTEQPWNLISGTGEFAGVHGNGTRSTTPSGTVEYYGTIRP